MNPVGPSVRVWGRGLRAEVPRKNERRVDTRVLGYEIKGAVVRSDRLPEILVSRDVESLPWQEFVLVCLHTKTSYT